MARVSKAKEGEWEEGAVKELLDAYEAKWKQRNRGNLRLGDWEDVSNQIKSVKSPAQCKNKIEAMKKKYRSEAAGSQWPFLSRMDFILRCPSRTPGIPGGMDAGSPSLCDQLDRFSQQSPIPNTLRILSQDNLQMLRQHFQMDQHDKPTVFALESDRSPSSSNAKRLRQAQSDVATNIKSFAESILKLEQAKMEMYKDTEMLRANAETRRAEIELRRTQIVMDTHLQIAKLISRKRKANNESHVAKQNDVVSAVEVEGQPDLQFGNPENSFRVLEASLRQE